MDIGRSIEVTVQSFLDGKCMKHWESMSANRQTETMLKVGLVSVSVFVGVALLFAAAGVHNGALFWGTTFGALSAFGSWCYLTAQHGMVSQVRDIGRGVMNAIQGR